MATKTSWKSNTLFPQIKNTLELGKDLVVFDLETTGLSPVNDRIIEIAAIKYRVNEDYDMTEIGWYHSYINPERPLDPKIIELTGITDEMLADAPTEDMVFDDIKAFFDDCILSGYNIDNFDVKFINELYGRHGQFFNMPGSIDGIKMARNRLVRGTDVPGFKLVEVGKYFGIDFQAHSAMEDTRTTAQVIQIFLHEYAAEESAPTSPLPTGTLRPAIRTICFWAGFKGFSRIYVNTDIGSVYYDIRSSVWGGKDIDVSTIDMDWLEQEAFRLVNASTESEFAAFKGNISIPA